MSSARLHNCTPLVTCAPCYFSAAAWLSSIDWHHCQGISPYSVGSQSGWTRVFTYQSPRNCLCQCYEVHQGLGIWRPKCNSQAGEWFLEELFWLHRPWFSMPYCLNKDRKITTGDCELKLKKSRWGRCVSMIWRNCWQSHKNDASPAQW